MGVKGAESLARGWIAPLQKVKYFFVKYSMLGNAGWEPPLVPVELRPLPVAHGQGGVMKQETPPFKAG
jgi:hypothetical protein